MNHNLRHNIIKRTWLVKLINILFRLKNRTVFLREVDRRRKISIFNFAELVRPLQYSPTDIVIDNNLYGLSYCLKKYAGIDTSKGLNSTIEHGVFFGNLVREDDFLYKVDNIITFGTRREKHLQAGRINKNIIPIGPYIHYAEPLLSNEDFQQTKAKLGKVLLVFPSHSIVGVAANYCFDSFIAEIEKVRKDFDTVLVSLYWIDAMNSVLVKKYEDLGYKIVTSGHRYDLCFLSRQRSIIELSDYTMSNNLGTHVGYCIYLNKPHYIFRQSVSGVAKNEKIKKHADAVRNELQQISCDDEFAEGSAYFNKRELEITKDQRRIVDEIWGISHIKSQNELQNILK